jgi:hypothetical protein
MEMAQQHDLASFGPGPRISGPYDYMFAPTYHHEPRPFDRVRVERYKSDVKYIKGRIGGFFKRQWVRISRRRPNGSAEATAIANDDNNDSDDGGDSRAGALQNIYSSRRNRSLPWKRNTRQREG